ncbi:DUF4190 domain-containing protein [Catenulispora yoronensis]
MSYNPEGDAASGNPIQDRIPEGYPPPNAWHAPGGEAPPPRPASRRPPPWPATRRRTAAARSASRPRPASSHSPASPASPATPSTPVSPTTPATPASPYPGLPRAAPGTGPDRIRPRPATRPSARVRPAGPGYGPPGYGPPAPGYGPPGYPPPPYGPYLVRKTNGMAVTGMVLGIVSLVLFWAWFFGPVLAVLGLIFSGVGISQCGRTGQEGKGMAIAGLVCSLISASLWVLLVIAVESFVHSL